MLSISTSPLVNIMIIKCAHRSICLKTAKTMTSLIFKKHRRPFNAYRIGYIKVSIYNSIPCDKKKNLNLVRKEVFWKHMLVSLLQVECRWWCPPILYLQPFSIKNWIWETNLEQHRNDVNRDFRQDRQRENKYCSAEMKIDFKKQRLQQNNNTAVTGTDRTDTGKRENIAGHIWQFWQAPRDSSIANLKNPCNACFGSFVNCPMRSLQPSANNDK